MASNDRSRGTGAGVLEQDKRGALELHDELTDEELSVLLWRYEQLLAHGYADPDAWTIARDTSIDLELARRLVAKLGCPVHLAKHILV
jgi:hypothetical protein